MDAWLRTVIALVVGLVSLLLYPMEGIGQRRAPILQSLDLAVLQPPVVVPVGGVRHLVYELHITNLRAADVALTRLEVRDVGSKGANLGDFQDAALRRTLGRPGISNELPDNRLIGAGLRAVFYAWIPLVGQTPPSALTHRLEFDLIRSTGREHVVMEGAQVSVRIDQPLVLGPPLQGGEWVAVYHPDVDRGHRRAIYTLDGRARIPARFAIDWMKLGPGRGLWHDDRTKLTNWYGYNSKVLAVADATVVEVKEDVLEDSSIAESAAPVPLEYVSGNYITLDLGGGRYAFYEHLRHRSIRVKPGDLVRRGEVIASIGNTGSSSSGPHLHFHISDANSPLGAEGIPYVLDSYQNLDTFKWNEDAGKNAPASPRATALIPYSHHELPAPNAIVNF